MSQAQACAHRTAPNAAWWKPIQGRGSEPHGASGFDTEPARAIYENVSSISSRCPTSSIIVAKWPTGMMVPARIEGVVQRLAQMRGRRSARYSRHATAVGRFHHTAPQANFPTRTLVSGHLEKSTADQWLRRNGRPSSCWAGRHALYGRRRTKSSQRACTDAFVIRRRGREGGCSISVAGRPITPRGGHRGRVRPTVTARLFDSTGNGSAARRRRCFPQSVGRSSSATQRPPPALQRRCKSIIPAAF